MVFSFNCDLELPFYNSLKNFTSIFHFCYLSTTKAIRSFNKLAPPKKKDLKISNGNKQIF